MVSRRIRYSCQFYLLVALILIATTALASWRVYYYYDPMGRLAAVREDGGNMFKYYYDEVGNRTRSDVYYISVGVFNPATKQWTFDTNDNFIYDGADKTIIFANAGTHPVTGDWDGDGIYEIGEFVDGTWYLDTNGNRLWDGDDPQDLSDDQAIAFGQAGDIPVTGDCDADGVTELGVYTGSGAWDTGECGTVSGFMGLAGEVPVMGDWDGDGYAEIGVFVAGEWYLDANGNHLWDGDDPIDPNDDIYADTRTQYVTGDIPVTGDWNVNGKTGIGLYRAGTWYPDFNDDGVLDDMSAYSFGVAGDIPFTGRW